MALACFKYLAKKAMQMGLHTLVGGYRNPFGVGSYKRLQPIIFWHTLTNSPNAIANSASACTMVMHGKMSWTIRWLCPTGRSMVPAGACWPGPYRTLFLLKLPGTALDSL